MVNGCCTWFSVSPALPRRWDLAQYGWQIVPQFRAAWVERAFQVVVDWRIGFRCYDWLDLRSKHRALVLGVDCQVERAQLLRLGFGAVLHQDAPLDEISARLRGMCQFFNGASRGDTVRSKSPSTACQPLDLPPMMPHTVPASQAGLSHGSCGSHHN